MAHQSDVEIPIVKDSMDSLGSPIDPLGARIMGEAGCGSKLGTGTSRWHRASVLTFFRGEEPSRPPFAKADLRTDDSSVTRKTTGRSVFNVTESQAASSCDTMRELITFHGDSHLLRATSVSTVLHSFAALLTDSSGSAETYELSSPVEAIDAFISHNWSTSRADKFLSMVIYFNFNAAILASVVAVVAVAGATAAGLIHLIDGEDGRDFGFVCALAVCPVFLLFAFLWHEVQDRLLCTSGSMLFLDKTCINQVDTHLQQEGIRKIAAFIRRSSRMVIIYSDIYLQRLWTVYEVACFLSLHTTDHLVIIPTYAPKVVLSGIILFWLAAVIRAVQRFIFAAVSDYGIARLFYAIGVLALSVTLRRAARMKEAIREHMERFQVRNCVCGQESDRPQVYANIAVLMQATGHVGDRATQEEALDEFNSLVRADLFPVLTTSLGPLGLKYSQVVAMFLVAFWPNTVDYYFGVGDNWKYDYATWTSCGMAYASAWTLGVFPLAIAFITVWCGKCIQLSGCCERAYVALGCVLVAAFCVVADMQGLRVVAVCAEGSHLALGGICVASICTACFAMELYAGFFHPAQRTED